MINVKKLVKTGCTVAAAAAGAYLTTGVVLYEGALSRWGYLNMKPDEPLNEEYNMNKYLNNEYFRKADDWFVGSAPVETRLLNTDGKTLHAEVIMQPEESHLWLVAVHGYSSRPRSMAKQAYGFFEDGYNCLFPYQRGHRKSEHNHCTMGYYESKDIIAWINYIVSVDPESQIVVLGESMGAATVMMVTGEDLPENVKCAVEDCGYTNCYDQLAGQIGNVLHLPKFPFIPAANTAARLFHGWDFRDCSPVDAVARSKTPTLFIHGEEDTFVPFEMEAVVYDACSAEKDIISIPDAEHAEACDVHPELYWPKVREFVAKYVK